MGIPNKIDSENGFVPETCFYLKIMKAIYFFEFTNVWLVIEINIIIVICHDECFLIIQ